MNFSPRKNTLAILCGGGPAPGINSVISSVTIEARKHDWDVLGIYDGFAYLCKGVKNVVPLTIDMVSRIHYNGGSMLRMSRANPTKKEETLRLAVETLLDLGVTHLVTIGGDDTAYSAFKVSEYAKNELGAELNVVHVPKTIDNDLPLPEGVPTFGFETARALGANLVANLMEDARTTGRWYFAVAMGRTAGHLALGIGKSSSATLTIIPEAFGGEQIRLKYLVDMLTAAIIKRLATKRDYGVAVVAEGMVERIAIEDFKNLDADCLDEHGHIRYAELNFPEVLKEAVTKNLAELGIKMTIVGKEIGYELRCAAPNAYDIEYTRNLGYAAFAFLRGGKSDALITIQDNKINPIPFVDILDMKTKKTKVRMVNIHSVQYQIAREYMVFLKKADLEEGPKLKAMAEVARLTPAEFCARFNAIAR